MSKVPAPHCPYRCKVGTFPSPHFPMQREAEIQPPSPTVPVRKVRMLMVEMTEFALQCWIYLSIIHGRFQELESIFWPPYLIHNFL